MPQNLGLTHMRRCQVRHLPWRPKDLYILIYIYIGNPFFWGVLRTESELPTLPALHTNHILCLPKAPAAITLSSAEAFGATTHLQVQTGGVQRDRWGRVFLGTERGAPSRSAGLDDARRGAARRPEAVPASGWLRTGMFVRVLNAFNLSEVYSVQVQVEL